MNQALIELVRREVRKAHNIICVLFALMALTDSKYPYL